MVSSDPDPTVGLQTTPRFIEPQTVETTNGPNLRAQIRDRLSRQRKIKGFPSAGLPPLQL